MEDRGGAFSFFRDIHITIDLYRHLYKTYGHQKWTAGTSRDVDSLETNRTGTCDFVKLRSRD